MRGASRQSVCAGAHQVVDLAGDEALEDLAVGLLAQLAQPLQHVLVGRHAAPRFVPSCVGSLHQPASSACVSHDALVGDGRKQVNPVAGACHRGECVKVPGAHPGCVFGSADGRGCTWPCRCTSVVRNVHGRHVSWPVTSTSLLARGASRGSGKGRGVAQGHTGQPADNDGAQRTTDTNVTQSCRAHADFTCAGPQVCVLGQTHFPDPQHHSAAASRCTKRQSGFAPVGEGTHKSTSGSSLSRLEPRHPFQTSVHQPAGPDVFQTALCPTTRLRKEARRTKPSSTVQGSRKETR